MKRISFVGFALVTLIFQNATVAAPPQKYQSLSNQEKQLACQVALARQVPGLDYLCDNTLPVGRGGLRQSPQSSTLDTELLLIERRPADKNQPSANGRLADVYTYDYRSDTLNHSVINLENNQIMDSEDLKEVQLPLTKNEIDRARSIVSQDTILRGLLEREYLKITGKPLQSLDQLEVKAFVFLASSMPGQLNQRSRQCGLHRCARLVMHTQERIALETAPIIDLSTTTVSQHSTGQ
ncbi:MAG: hypothetical protein V3W04_08300 [Gammaproteobacteria bacterium]